MCDLRRRLVENGRQVLAESPTWDEIAARFVEVLERTAQGKEGSRQSATGSGLVAAPSSLNQGCGFGPVPSESDPENTYGQASLHSESGGKMTSGRSRQELDLNRLGWPTADCRRLTAFCIPQSDDRSNPVQPQGVQLAA